MKRERRFHLLFTGEEYNVVKGAANRLGLSVSELCRRATVHASRHALGIGLSPTEEAVRSAKLAADLFTKDGGLSVAE
jgi:hypothetical protein